MSGRVHPIFLVLVVVLAAAAGWHFFLRDDGGGSAPIDGSESRHGDDDGASGKFLRAGGLAGVKAELLHLPYKDAYSAQLQVAVDPALFPDETIDIADIYEIEIRFTDMDPPLADMESTGLLQPGWNERDVEGGYRFFTIDSPVPRDGRWAKWQFRLDTSLEPGAGPKLKSGKIRLYDREGTLIGIRELTIR